MHCSKCCRQNKFYEMYIFEKVKILVVQMLSQANKNSIEDIYPCIMYVCISISSLYSLLILSVYLKSHIVSPKTRKLIEIVWVNYTFIQKCIYAQLKYLKTNCFFKVYKIHLKLTNKIV